MEAIETERRRRHTFQQWLERRKSQVIREISGFWKSTFRETRGIFPRHRQTPFRFRFHDKILVPKSSVRRRPLAVSCLRDGPAGRFQRSRQADGDHAAKQPFRPAAIQRGTEPAVSRRLSEGSGFPAAVFHPAGRGPVHMRNTATVSIRCCCRGTACRRRRISTASSRSAWRRGWNRPNELLDGAGFRFHQGRDRSC